MSAKVMVMMSGGVDSSVAAALLRDQGYDVTGATLKLWGGESDSGCCSVGDVEDARRVAAQLDIPHYVFNFSDDFNTRVVDPYVAAYGAGMTPNPCVDCNRELKWGRAFDRARRLGFDFVATGHHARIVTDDDGDPALARGADPAKDQSYVLYMLDRQQLAHTLLPVGEMTKADVRAIAATLGLRTAAKRESMDVCFITRNGRESFLGARIPRRPGMIVATDGAPVGAHNGVDAFTIGQRRRVGVAQGERRYVVDIDADEARVVVGDRVSLLRDRAELRDLRLTRTPPARISVQTRAHGTPVAAHLEGNEVVFGEPQPRVAPGQVIACYDGDICCGGGIVAA
jgi:tRNA-specific 2-thiouridylase